MNLLLVAGAAVAAGVAVLLITRRGEAATLEPATDESEWRRMTDAEVTPELGDVAVQILAEHSGEPYGTVVPFWDGQYAGIIEEHYNEPGGARRPWGYHPGVTLYARA